MKRDKGYWSPGAKPSSSAEVKNISSSYQKSIGLFGSSFETVVDFTDGYTYVSYKTKTSGYTPKYRSPATIGVEYSVDDELRNEIISDAIAAHKEAVGKKVRY